MRKYLFLLIAFLLTAVGSLQAQQGTSSPLLDSKYDFKATTPDGKVLYLHELMGKTDYVLVDFWASWCGPCRFAIKELKELYPTLPAGRLQILSCSVDQDETRWRKALAEDQMPWPQVFEGDNYCSGKYNVQYIPHLVLFDRYGNLIGSRMSLDDVKAKVAQPVKKKYASPK